MTQIAYLGNWAFTVERSAPMVPPVGLQHLGFALPAAMGAKDHEPRRAMLALAGDFGLQFTFAS